MTRAQRIAAILDRMDYRNQTPQRLVEAIIETAGEPPTCCKGLAPSWDCRCEVQRLAEIERAKVAK